MPNVVGATLKYLSGGVEQRVKSVKPDHSFDIQNVTNSTTVSPGTDTTVMRANRRRDIETFLYAPYGTELATGTCVLDTFYLVTLGTVGGHGVGTIFKSAGTESLSSSNKVRACGNVITGANSSFAVTIGGSAFYIKSFSYDEVYDEKNFTSTSTTSPNKDIQGNRLKATSHFQCFMERATALKIGASTPAIQPITVTLASGQTIAGSCLFTKMTIDDDVDKEVLVDYDIDWQGVPVKTNIGFLTLNSAVAFVHIFETGSSTNAQESGTINYLSMSLKMDVESVGTISYKGVITGTPTFAVYS